MLLDALRDASETRQVLATSHSPDLLDSLVDPDELLAVRADGGTTTVARLDPAGQDVTRSELYTAGELLRADQLVPDRAQPIQTDLFA
ncbi:ATP-binding protein [Agilicoccus flavus]|uniref:ATP-binding protein n=1 Tax=Agilicoccus flavus TaxID=2775968 RepID=UPI001CF61FEF|nr:ATP-binding protein [Agilicoccus flavus]